MSQAYAAGGLCSSVLDLLRWTRLLTGGAVLRRETYERMVEPATLRDGQRIEYGFGFATAYIEGRRQIMHMGGMRGVAGHLAHYPEDDLTVVVLTNTEGAPAAAIESRVARLVLELGEQAARDLPLTTAELARYTGSYDIRLATVTLTARDGRLHASSPDPGIEDVSLLYQGDHTFLADGDPQTWVRFELRGDTAVAFTLMHQGIPMTGTRVASGGGR
jgi:hypothetical protein